MVTEIHAVFSISAANKLQGSFWVTQDGNLVTSGLGTASYVVYDSDGITVGLAESDIPVDSIGLFTIEPLPASVLVDLTHYLVKITVVVNGISISTFKAITLGE